MILGSPRARATASRRLGLQTFSHSPFRYFQEPISLPTTASILNRNPCYYLWRCYLYLSWGVGRCKYLEIIRITWDVTYEKTIVLIWKSPFIVCLLYTTRLLLWKLTVDERRMLSEFWQNAFSRLLSHRQCRYDTPQTTLIRSVRYTDIVYIQTTFFNLFVSLLIVFLIFIWTPLDLKKITTYT